MDDAGEIAGYVPSSAYLVVVRDNAVLAELLPKVPGAWTTELKPHHKISPNLLLIDDGIDDTNTDASLFKAVNPEHHVAAYPPPVDGVDAAVIAADAEAVIRLLGLDAKVETTSRGAVLVSGNVTDGFNRGTRVETVDALDRAETDAATRGDAQQVHLRRHSNRRR